MKDILQIIKRYEEESEDVFHSGFRTDNESINESKRSAF